MIGIRFFVGFRCGSVGCHRGTVEPCRADFLQAVGGCVLSDMVGTLVQFSFLPFFARCSVVFAWLGCLLVFGVFRAVWGYFRLILPLFSLGCLVAFVRVAVFSGIIAILTAFLNLAWLFLLRKYENSDIVKNSIKKREQAHSHF